MSQDVKPKLSILEQLKIARANLKDKVKEVDGISKDLARATIGLGKAVTQGSKLVSKYLKFEIEPGVPIPVIQEQLDKAIAAEIKREREATKAAAKAAKAKKESA